MEIKKDVTFGKEGRAKLKNGIDKVANAVKATLGARGRCVIIDKEPYAPIITKDGVTVANSIDLLDPIENMGCKLVKQVANKTANDSGDGTTSSTILTQEILTRGLASIDSGSNPIEVHKGIIKAVDKVVEFLKSIAVSITDNYEKLRQVALISANGDEEVATLIADVMSKIGVDGSVTVEYSHSEITRTEVVDGTKIPYGYMANIFVTNPAKMRAEHKECEVFMYDGHLNTMNDIIPILTAYSKAYPPESQFFPPLVIFAGMVDGEALSFFIENKRERSLMTLIVNINGSQSDKLDILEDIKSVVGGQIINQGFGTTLKDFNYEMFGKAPQVIATSKHTIITSIDGSETIKAQAEVIKSQIDLAKEDQLKVASLKGRLARLNGGVAVVYVGGKTQAEMLERKDRIDDTIGATTAAMIEGIVPGGGIALYRAIDSLKDLEVDSPHQNIGVAIIRESLSAPLIQILKNGGYEDVTGIKSIDKVLHDLRETSGSYGFNIITEQVVDMIEEGIIDPVKVVRNSIENSSSIAGLLLTTEVVINNTKV